MTELKRYRIHYRINGEPASLLISSFEMPGLEQAELEILLHHVREPRAAVDAPGEPGAPQRSQSLERTGRQRYPDRRGKPLKSR